MKNLVVLSVLVFLMGCSTPKLTPDELEKIKQEVIDNDIAFSNYSDKNGFAKALAAYASDDAIKLSPRQYSTFGIDELQQQADADSIGSSQGALTWKPLKVHLSESGDLAAAFGDWYFKFKSPKTSRDTVLYGNYLTVWRKQQDGKWKFVLDGGNPVPGPTTAEMLTLIN